MTKKYFSRLLSLICALLLFTAALPAAATGTKLAVSADSTAINVGDNVSVTIVVSGEKLGAVEGGFTYDPAVLSYLSGSGGAADGTLSMVSAASGGSSSLTAVVKFVAIAPGETVINVTADKAYDYDEQELTVEAAGVSIAVSGTAEVQEGTPTEFVSPSLTGVLAHNVEGTSTELYIRRSLEDLTLPSGYADRQVEYYGEYVGGAAIPDTEEPVLLYLEDANAENAGYYIYDVTRDMLYPYVTVLSVSATYTLILPTDDVTPPDGFTETQLEAGTRTLSAWTNGSVYIVYARNSSGETGFFVYNADDKSVQRYVAPPEPTPEPTPTPIPVDTEPAQTGFTPSAYIFYGVCGLAAVLLVLCIIAFSGKAKVQRKLKAVIRRKKALNESPEDKA